MFQRHSVVVIFSLIACAGVFLMNQTAHSDPATPAKERVFEIRTYTTEPGKLPDLLKRFRDHTTKLFEKHGMTNIGYWVPTDEPRSKNTLIYILAHDSRDAAKQSWKDFQADPDWIKVKAASEANGKLVTKIESIFAAPTDFSPIR
jgi:NIPSNAP